MKRNLIASVIAVVAFTLLFGLVYPLVVTGVGQLVFGDQADGSRIERDGELVGSSLIGQEFTKRAAKPGKPGKFQRVPDERYFQSRPSATGYSANVTFFNNLGPNNAELSELFAANAQAYLELEGPLHARARLAE